MGIEKHIDAYLDGKDKPGIFGEPFDLVAVMALARCADENRGHAADVSRKGGCLTENELAAFVELKRKHPGYDRALHHMADCSQCRRRAFDLSRLLLVEEGDSPVDLIDNAFAEARSMRGELKHSPGRRLFFLAAAAATVVIALSGVLYQVFKPEPGAAYITFFAGNVELICKGKPAVPVPKLVLGDADLIRTGANSFVILQIDESIVVRIAGNSTVSMKSILDRKNRELVIHGGKVLSNVAKLPKDGAYKVRTPVIVAAVLGTEFSVTYEPGMAVVAVRRSAGGVAVVAGRKETVAPQGTAVTFTDREKSRVISDVESLELENISKIPMIDGIETKTEAEVRDILEPLLGSEAMPKTTLEQIRAKYGRIDIVILYNGRVLEGVILSRGENYTILTTAGKIIVPERQIRTIRVR
jgi:ferric-dicitrate binding protein FerR (iron transport regulator)